MKQKKEINIQIGERIKEAREQKKLTQEQLAERVDVSPQYVSDLERGVVGVSLSTLIRICSCLTVTSDRILFGREALKRTEKLSGLCDELSDAQFDRLTSIVEKYIEAIKAERKTYEPIARE